MTIQHLDKMFKPATIAVIGASETPGKLGNLVTRNVLGAGFEGEIFPANPKYDTVAGVAAYPDVPSLPAAPDLAVIITPPETVPGIIGQLGKKGTRAAASHTGAMAGSDAVYDAAFRRAGMLRVSDMQALFDAVGTLAVTQSVSGDRLAILTNGGGVGVMATDTLIDKKGRLASFEEETLTRLDTILPPTWSHGNPVDIIGDATARRYSAALEILLDDPNTDAVLVLNCPTAVASSTEAAAGMIARIREAFPKATIEGFTVQPFIQKPHAHELIVGMTEDAQFGPVILFGHGGTAVEVIDDQSIALPPLNMHLAHEVISHTRIFRLLQGYRGTPAANIEAVALTLVEISQLICDIPEIAELDINPLLVDGDGVIALDARIRVAPAKDSATDRLAIRPYHKELEETIRLPDGLELMLRPIRPEDEPAFHDLFGRLSMEEIRLRFLHYMKILSHSLAARLTQIDYDRQMALVLTDPPGMEDARQLYGAVRISADANNDRAEFAILLRGDMTGMGLGPLLMRRIIDYSKNRGIRELYGDVLASNKSMLALSRAFGFKIKSARDEPGVMMVTLNLSGD